MMDRRRFLASAAGIFAAPLAAGAQQVGKVYRIGLLASTVPTKSDPLLRPLWEELQRLGYTEGQNLAVEFRTAGGKMDRLPALAADLVDLKVDLIVAPTTLVAPAAVKASRTIPVVFRMQDPVGLGLVASLARPAGNATGVDSMNTDLAAKRLELLKEILPHIRRVAILMYPGRKTHQGYLAETQIAAKALGVQLQPVEADESQLAPAFDRMAAGRADAVIVFTVIPHVSERQRLAALAARHRLPVMFDDATFVEAGGIVAFEPNPAEILALFAAQIDRILKGAKPSDVPVLRPTKFQLTINLKTAKALGLTIPPSVLARADEVIQ